MCRIHWSLWLDIISIALPEIAVCAESTQILQIVCAAFREWRHMVKMKDNANVCCRTPATQNTAEIIACHNIESGPQWDATTTLGDGYRSRLIRDYYLICVSLDRRAHLVLNEGDAGLHPTVEVAFVGIVADARFSGFPLISGWSVPNLAPNALQLIKKSLFSEWASFPSFEGNSIFL